MYFFHEELPLNSVMPVVFSIDISQEAIPAYPDAERKPDISNSHDEGEVDPVLEVSYYNQKAAKMPT